jgi:predicted amidophosphoribosyltransferase
VRGAWSEWWADVHPAQCRVCAQPLESGALCCALHELALERLQLAGPRCARCAVELAPALADGVLCAECRHAPPAYEQVLALGSYGGGLRDWVLALKHRGRRDLAQPLGEALAERWREHAARSASGAASEADSKAPAGDDSGGDRASVARFRASSPAARAGCALVPLPLHAARALERGYDQAQLLAAELAEQTGLPLWRALRRVRATQPQGSALAAPRAANVRGAFALRRFGRARLRAAELWLVDDVLTSGASAAECARLLRSAGARCVRVLCVARA